MEHIGEKARDKITGLEGRVSGKTKHLFGCDTYQITPSLNKEGKMSESHTFDAGRIEFLGNRIQPSAELKMPDESLLGKRARDKMTGFVGTITTTTVFFDGERYVGVTPNAKDNDIGESYRFNINAIEILPEKQVKPETVKGPKPGGDHGRIRNANGTHR